MAPKTRLVRLAAVDCPDGGPSRARVTLDVRATLAGRGAYVCRSPQGAPDAECFSRALARRAFARAFRRAVEVPSELVESVGR